MGSLHSLNLIAGRYWCPRWGIHGATGTLRVSFTPPSTPLTRARQCHIRTYRLYAVHCAHLYQTTYVLFKETFSYPVPGTDAKNQVNLPSIAAMMQWEMAECGAVADVLRIWPHKVRCMFSRAVLRAPLPYDFSATWWRGYVMGPDNGRDHDVEDGI